MGFGVYFPTFSTIMKPQSAIFLFNLSRKVNGSAYAKYHKFAFLDFYQKTTGKKISEISLNKLKNKHPYIDKVSHDDLQSALQILQKFRITPLEACHNPHLFYMNQITMDNYGEILKECGFIEIKALHILRYHTIVRSKTIEQLKKKGLIPTDFNLEETLHNCFKEWPAYTESIENFKDNNSTILMIRMGVLQKFLQWRLSVTPEEFQKYCRNYMPLKHKPMSDICEALDIAQNIIEFDIESIRRNGFIIASDPVKTKLIIENVGTIAGIDIKEAIRIEPAILKNNYKSLLHIKDIMEVYGISEKAQRLGLKVYCMKPQTVQERLEELKCLKEYQVLASNPRILYMVIHKKKVMTRLSKIQEAKKQCYSLNNLVASSKVFSNYINGFGNKVCSRDIAALITSSVKDNDMSGDRDTVRYIVTQLKRHKYFLHTALNVIDENLKYLKKSFDNETIFNHCQLLLYPESEISRYLKLILDLRNRNMREKNDNELEGNYNNLSGGELTDDQVLSLVLYEIEKKYHFSGDGIWARIDGLRADSRPS